MPGVSMKMIWKPGGLWIPWTRFRVVWGLSEVMTIFSPRIRLRSVDFPALGRPMMAMKPERNGWSGMASLRSGIVQVGHDVSFACEAITGNGKLMGRQAQIRK